MFVVKVDASGFDSMRKGFAQMQAKLPKVIAQALNQGGDKVRTQVQRGLKQQTNVKLYKSITSRMRTMRAYEGNLSYVIIATGKGIPIEEFPVSVTSRGVDAKTWGVDHVFKRSFRQKERGGLRARLTSAHFPIRRLYGPALPKELEKGEIPSIFERSAEEFVPPAIIKAIARVIG